MKTKYALRVEDFHGTGWFVTASGEQYMELTPLVLMTRDELVVAVIRETADGKPWQYLNVILVGAE